MFLTSGIGENGERLSVPNRHEVLVWSEGRREWACGGGRVRWERGVDDEIGRGTGGGDGVQGGREAVLEEDEGGESNGEGSYPQGHTKGRSSRPGAM